MTGILTAETYEYDDAGRLIKVTWDEQRSITYQYDAAGNIVRAALTKSGVTPAVRRSSPVSWLWVVLAGWMAGLAWAGACLLAAEWLQSRGAVEPEK